MYRWRRSWREAGDADFSREVNEEDSEGWAIAW
jgi:hypothetical protein